MPAFPEYVGFAETEQEALALAREGIAFEIERLREQGQAPPTEPAPPKVLLVAA
jgi:predicted RNase H-like HicB family nuclease